MGGPAGGCSIGDVSANPVDTREAVRRLEAAARDGRLDEICDRRRVRLLGVFGGAADDSAESPDDVDVAVSFAGEPAVLELLGDLVDLTGFDRIDLAVIDGAGPVLRARALVGIPLYESARGDFARTQMAALAEYRDTAPLRRLALDVLAR